MPKISLPQKNLVLDAPVGANLMTFLQSQNIPVASSCLGEGICSMCKMKIHGELTPPEKFEIETLRRNKGNSDERLSCQISIQNDLVVETKYW
jgi:ferredoxin, 2Fe-2S